jgi:alpha-L-arabinofuranosidase
MEKMFVDNTGDYILPYSLRGSICIPPSQVKKIGDVIIKAVNASGDNSSTEITLEGVAKDTRIKINTITLISKNLSDQNSLANPTKVIPLAKTFTGLANFNYSFPAYSVTVLRISFVK